MSDIVYLSPSHLTTALAKLIPTGRPIWIHGKPGAGKTSIVRQVAADIGYECPHFPPAVTLDPVDMRGVPSIDRQQYMTVWYPPSFWPRDPLWKGVIFVDELPQADKSVQSGFLQLTYGGRLGDYVVPENASFVVCGNRAEDRAGVNRVITPLLNRFIHFGLETSLEDWRAWALSAGISPVIRSFLAFKPLLFDTFDPTQHQTAFASPRSWEIASHVFAADLSRDLLHAGIAGCVGAGPAAEFVAFAEIYTSLPDVEEVLARPEKFKAPSEPSVNYALAGALAEAVKMPKTEQQKLKNFVSVVERLSDEYGTLAMKDGVALNSRILAVAGSWLKTRKNFLLLKD